MWRQSLCGLYRDAGSLRGRGTAGAAQTVQRATPSGPSRTTPPGFLPVSARATAGKHTIEAFDWRSTQPVMQPARELSRHMNVSQCKAGHGASGSSIWCRLISSRRTDCLLLGQWVSSNRCISASWEMTGRPCQPRRACGAVLLRDLLDAGVTLAGRSDAPIALYSPLPGTQTAMTRRTARGLEHQEAISDLEALRLWTTGRQEGSLTYRSAGRYGHSDKKSVRDTT